MLSVVGACLAASAAQAAPPLETQSSISGQDQPGLSGDVSTNREDIASLEADTLAPTVLRVNGSDSFEAVKVVFSEPVDAITGSNPSNYSLSGGLTISSATVMPAPNHHTVILETSMQAPGTPYTLEVGGIQDESGNVMLTQASQDFSSFIWMEGVVLHKFWNNISGGLDGLQNDPRFPDSPDFVTLEPAWEYGPDGSNESGSDYGNQLVGWFVPPETGNYIFFTNSDDPSNLYLSTDDDPANKLWIAQEAGWSNARNWVSVGGGSIVDDKRSDYFINSEWPTLDIKLNAGERYYLESIHTEGGGGDSVAATVIRTSDPDPMDGDPPTLTGSLIGTYLDPTGADISIQSQPANTEVPDGMKVDLTIAATGTSAYGSFVNIQWQSAPAGSSDFVNIPGKTGDTLRTDPLTKANDGIQYRAVLTVPTLSVTSEVATITVVDYIAPDPLVAGNVIAINLGADEPAGGGSAVTGAAGVLGTRVWNNVVGASGTETFLSADANGKAANSSVSVTWNSPNTWSSRGRGEENNNGGGNDGILMTGYIDTNASDPNSVVISGLPADLSYDVIVYTKGGVNGRGGEYTVSPGIADGLVALWNFDDQNLLDSLGTYDGEERGSDIIGFTDGPSAPFGKALTLDGIDQYVEITGGDNTALSFAGGSMSVSTWFRAFDFDKSWQALIADGESNRWRLHRRGGEGGFAWVGGNGDTPVGADVSIGEWHHIVAVADAAGLDGYGSKVWLDGEVYAVNETAANLGENNLNIMIGENPDALGRTWNGDIDDVGLWNRPLSESEVQALAAGNPITFEGVTQEHVDAEAFGEAFIEGPEGDFIVFKNVSGSSIAISGQPTTGSPARAPINAVEILIGGGFTEPVINTGGGDEGAISGVSLQDGKVVIEFTGTLKSADSVTGPYNAVAGASSPYSVAPAKAAEFYIAE